MDKKVYVIMSTQMDCECNDWDVLDDEIAFTTKELAQEYLNKHYICPECYFILELTLIEINTIK